jgi:hypothetical protein
MPTLFRGFNGVFERRIVRFFETQARRETHQGVVHTVERRVLREKAKFVKPAAVYAGIPIVQAVIAYDDEEGCWALYRGDMYPTDPIRLGDAHRDPHTAPTGRWENAGFFVSTTPRPVVNFMHNNGALVALGALAAAVGNMLLKERAFQM